MLKKMIIHGLVAAALVGVAAAGYAQTKKDTSHLAPSPAAPSAAPAKSDDIPVVQADTGYVQTIPSRVRKSDHDRDGKYRDRHDSRKRHHSAHEDDD